MAEFVRKYDVTAGQLAPATPFPIDITIPPSAAKWSLHITPIDGGGGPAPGIELQYDAGSGDYKNTNPPASAVAQKNVVNIITRDDAINKVRLVITPGASVPDGGVKVSLFITRDN